MFESYKEDRTIVYKGSILSTLPYKFNRGNAVVFNNRLHILGGQNYSDNESLKHYSWDGTTWRSESTLPYSFDSGSAVAYNGKIHIIGGVNNEKKHYAWNGSSWSSVTTLPADFTGTAVVFDNKIHGLGFSSNQHYIFDGTSWTYKSTITYGGTGASNIKWYDAVVYNNSIIVDDYTRLLQWDGNTSWSRFYGQGFYQGACVVTYGSWIYGLGGVIDGSTAYYRGSGGLILKNNGSSLEYSHRAIPYDCCYGAPAIYNGNLYLIGGQATQKVLFNLSSSNNFI